MKRAIGSITFLTLVYVSASAQSYTIQNYSFEAPTQTPGGYNTSGLPGWSSGGGSASGSWWPNGQFSTPVPDGVLIGYTNGGSIAQQLTGTLVAGTTTLSGWGGTRNDGVSTTFSLELWAGGSVANGTVTGGTLLASADFLPVTPGTFAPISTSYVAGAGNAYLGQTLSIEILQTGSGVQSDFDGIQLSAAATPEPAPFAVAGLGLMGLLIRRRRSA